MSWWRRRPSWIDIAEGRAEERVTTEIPVSKDDEPISSRGAVVLSPAAPPAPKPADPAPWRWRLIAVVAAVGVIGVLATDHSRMKNLDGAAAKSAAHFAADAVSSAVIEDLSVDELDSCGEDMALVVRGNLRVCVDRWESALVELNDDGTERPWSPYDSVGEHLVKAISRPGVVPQAYISRDQAELACGEAGKRLCTSNEWVAACEGPGQTVYPYGDAEDIHACNSRGNSPLKAVFGNVRAALRSDQAMNHPALNQVPGTVAKTGSYGKCTNDFGVYDMVGNLHEWTADNDGTFRGGFYLDTHVNGNGCGYATTAHHPKYHDYSTGFRCCRDAN